MNILYALAGLRGDLLDTVFGFFTFFGEELCVLFLLCLLYWCLDKRLAYQICLVYFLSGLGTQLLKVICRVPRPWVLDPQFSPVPSALETATGYSFPSGHTQSATAFWGTLGLWGWRRRGRFRGLALAAGLLLPALTGLSRMYLGVHTPQDVITGYLITLAIALLVTGFFARNPEADSVSPRSAGLLFAASLAVTLIAALLMKTGYAEAEMAADCCKAGGAGMGFALGWYLESRYIRFSTKAPLPFQAVKLILGLAGAVLIQSGLKPVLGESIPADIFRYFLLVLWVMVGYPAGVKRLEKFSHA